MNVNTEELKKWIGRTDTLTDEITVPPVGALAAVLDRERAPLRGEAIPPCWHWLYFLPLRRQSELGPDGHPRRGSFLPPVPLPRRMWAGSRLEFWHPLHVGETVTRTSRIQNVSVKEGRSGPLVFVHVRHEIGTAAATALVEDQHIVYRELPGPGRDTPPATPAPGDWQWRREIQPDAVLLFRYSAVTFNSHRIHYDHRYSTDVEGYPGLVVHGPLVATLLLELLHEHVPDARVARFEFRAVAPLFGHARFQLCGRFATDEEGSVRLWAQGADGSLAMDATATLN
jgi:3-methylfumaryl-CoA hydratase